MGVGAVEPLLVLKEDCDAEGGGVPEGLRRALVEASALTVDDGEAHCEAVPVGLREGDADSACERLKVAQAEGVEDTLCEGAAEREACEAEGRLEPLKEKHAEVEAVTVMQALADMDMDAVRVGAGERDCEAASERVAVTRGEADAEPLKEKEGVGVAPAAGLALPRSKLAVARAPLLDKRALKEGEGVLEEEALGHFVPLPLGVAPRALGEGEPVVVGVGAEDTEPRVGESVKRTEREGVPPTLRVPVGEDRGGSVGVYGAEAVAGALAVPAAVGEEPSCGEEEALASGLEGDTVALPWTLALAAGEGTEAVHEGEPEAVGRRLRDRAPLADEEPSVEREGSVVALGEGARLLLELGSGELEARVRALRVGRGALRLGEGVA